MRELDHKESWAPKNWCFWTVVLEKTPESPLYHREIQPVHPKGNQSWSFTGRTDAEAEAPILWLLMQRTDSLEKTLMLAWERLKAGEEGDDRGWDGWMASPTWWIWVWASSGSWWWTGRPAMLQSMRLQRVHWETELTVVENPPANAGDVRDMGSNPGSGRSSGGGHGNPLQYSYLENPTDRETW